MKKQYYTDREAPKARTLDTITEAAWGGIFALINTLLTKDAFAYIFPETCPDGNGVCGTDLQNFRLSLAAEISEISFPLEEIPVPPNGAILDLIEFCHEHVAQPLQGSYHSFFQHHHYSFKQEPGQADFRARINTIFNRNGIAYELTDEGMIERLAPMGLRESLGSALFNTTDARLNGLLETARTKFLSRRLEDRTAALEKLWDAWERIKTILPGDKKQAIATLLDKVSPEPHMRRQLETEATTLTKIGNEFQIRHFETTRVAISDSCHVDYLFHRMFALIQLLLAAL